VELGGVLQIIRREIEVLCLPFEVPESFEIDVADLDIGDSIHVRDISQEGEIEFLEDENFTVVTLLIPKIEEEEEPAEEEEEEAEEAAVEGEVEEAPKADDEGLFMPQKRLRLVVGLGNPGDAYLKTRHNAGFMVVDEVAEAFSIPLVKRKFDTIFGRGSVDGVEIILIKPMAFMNLSGPPVLKIANYFKILCEDMLVIHDDIDLVLGRLKINEKGGDGGQED